MMQNLKNYLTNGLKNTLLFRNNAGISHNGPWKQVYTDTLLDRWHVGDFSNVEYTISADFDVNNKEIIKVLITASRDRAKAVVYARNNTLVNILTVSVTVNDSYVDVILNPIIDLEASPAIDFSGTKVIYTAQYFHAQTPLVI
jgi:alpha-N-acetylglucosamine transferase